MNCNLKGRGQGDFTHWKIKGRDPKMRKNIIADSPIYYEKTKIFSLVSLLPCYILVKDQDQVREMPTSFLRVDSAAYCLIYFKYVYCFARYD